MQVGGHFLQGDGTDTPLLKNKYKALNVGNVKVEFKKYDL